MKYGKTLIVIIFCISISYMHAMGIALIADRKKAAAALRFLNKVQNNSTPEEKIYLLKDKDFLKILPSKVPRSFNRDSDTKSKL